MMTAMNGTEAQEQLQQVLPTYKIIKKLGEGSFGAVFLAYDESTEQQYAVKVFRLEAQKVFEKGQVTSASTRLNRDWDLLKKHHSRFKTCRALVDIPMFFKVDKPDSAHGTASALGIAVMEYFPNNLYDYVLDYLEKHGKPLPATRRLELLQGLARTLQLLHEMTDYDDHPFVYEDLKPENVLVADDPGDNPPRIVIGDIGGLKRISASMSSGGQITQRYAAPEILRQGKRVDQQAAVYAFGLIGYFVIEGNIPYDAVSLDERFDLIDAKLDFTPEMLKGLESAGEVVRKCLYSDRQKRFANFEEVSQALSQKEERAGSGPTILPALHHEEPTPIPASADIKPLSNDKNIVTGSGETVVPVRPPDEEKVKNIQEEKSNDGQNIISQPSSSGTSKNNNLLAAAVFGMLLVLGIIIFVKDKDNQRTVDASSNSLQTVPPSPNVAQTDKKGPINENKVSAPLEDENERRKTEETKRETERLIQEAAKIKRDALEAKRIEAEAELARLREEERLRKEQEAKKRSEEESARKEAERLKEQKVQSAEDPLEPKKGKIWKEPITSIEFVGVPKGCFQMGMSDQEKNELKSDSNYDKFFKDAENQHEVCVNALWVGKTEVTVGQFRKFIDATGYKTDAEKDAGGKQGCFSHVDKDGKRSGEYVSGRSWQDPGFSQEENFPVVCVSWVDAQAFVKWMNKGTEDGKYRLLTEAEWEYAARAGTTSQRYWGDDPKEACQYANVADQTKDGKFGFGKKHECRDGFYFSAPVGHFKPNSFGLYDMLGNAWEWTCSEYDPTYGGKEKNCARSGNTGSLRVEQGSDRVPRGGSWFGTPASVRSAYRFSYDPGYRLISLGFRLSRTYP
ncbi:MAG: SUMF1/EgtB/PvdO family nonheme iron enzyme [Magnetococcales bacterium]|nr:SUMF1/EgtB/PvdO family nonheme iron enzyme [Magnetococcales bacterium]